MSYMTTCIVVTHTHTHARTHTHTHTGCAAREYTVRMYRIVRIYRAVLTQNMCCSAGPLPLDKPEYAVVLTQNICWSNGQKAVPCCVAERVLCRAHVMSWAGGWVGKGEGGVVRN